MLYIPIDLQLQWIREDLKQIKLQVCSDYKPAPMACPGCPDCNFAIASGLAKTCTLHAPEFMIRINIPMPNNANCNHEWDGDLIENPGCGNQGLCKHCGQKCYIALKE
jgi:hypothetical protein